MDRRQHRARRPGGAPGSKPTAKIFLPYVLVGVIILLAMVWIYAIGPSGESKVRGDLLHRERATETTPPPSERGSG